MFPLQGGSSPVTTLSCEHDAYPKFDTRPASLRPWLGRLIKPANFSKSILGRLWHCSFSYRVSVISHMALKSTKNLVLFLALGSKTAARIIARPNPAEDQY